MSPPDAASYLLVVDDNPTLRTLIQFALRPLGLPLLAATDGAEAVEVYARYQPAISLVLLDLHMPGRSGEQTRSELVQMDSGVRCLLISGAVWDGADALARPGVVGLLQKPFKVDALLNAVRRLLPQQA